MLERWIQLIIQNECDSQSLITELHSVSYLIIIFTTDNTLALKIVLNTYMSGDLNLTMFNSIVLTRKSQPGYSHTKVVSFKHIYVAGSLFESSLRFWLITHP